MAASRRGEKVFPNVSVRSGTGRSLMSPSRLMPAITNVTNRIVMPIRRMLIPEASEDFNSRPHRLNAYCFVTINVLLLQREHANSRCEVVLHRLSSNPVWCRLFLLFPRIGW